MSDTLRTLIERLRAAGRDERLSTGQLYLDAAEAIKALVTHTSHAAIGTPRDGVTGRRDGRDPDVCGTCGLFTPGPDVQGDACPGHDSPEIAPNGVPYRDMWAGGVGPQSQAKDDAESDVSHTSVECMILSTDCHCPSCGHNRCKSSVSSIDNDDGTFYCQNCSAEWREVP